MHASTPDRPGLDPGLPARVGPPARLLGAVPGGQVKLVKAGEGATLVLTVGSGFRLR
jgi:hypothetical protein